MSSPSVSVYFSFIINKFSCISCIGPNAFPLYSPQMCACFDCIMNEKTGGGGGGGGSEIETAVMHFPITLYPSPYPLISFPFSQAVSVHVCVCP